MPALGIPPQGSGRDAPGAGGEGTQPVAQSCLPQVVISTLLLLPSGFCLSRPLASKILHGEQEKGL